MRIQSFAGSLLFITGGVYGSAANCPGPVGDSFCQSITDSSGFCVPGAWTCSGTQIDCGCNFSAGISDAPSTTTQPVTSGSSARTTTESVASTTRATTRPPGTTPETTRTRGTAASPLSTTLTTTTSASPVSTATTTSASPVSTTAPSACGTSPREPIFVWTEWPGQADPPQYYSELLGFIQNNCGNLGVTRVILRITDPSVANLFTVDTTASLFVDFLTKVPAGVELHIYPYLLDARAQSNWASYRSTGRPLEGVFRYAQDWDSLLAGAGLGARISGVVLDGEEKRGFLTELVNVPTYKATYGVARLGVAIGFDQPGAAASYPQADDFYLEMYDFYVVNAPSLTLVQTAASDTPSAFLDELDANVLHPFVAQYSDARFQFMWSVQAKSRSDCLYPLGSGCGSSDDFGWFSAPDFNLFLRMVQVRYPVLAGRSHGIFQFSFVPRSWL